MWLPLIGLALGIALGLVLNVNVSPDLARYSAVAILAGLDSVLGAIRSELDDHYDWALDVMGDAWDPARARRRLRESPHVIAADALLDQEWFAGVGNIIKNEVLWRIRVHPESEVGALPPRKQTELVKQAREYSFDFLEWKKAFVLKKHYQVHTKTHCPRDDTRLTYRKELGRARRRAFFCETCQKLYRS